MADNDFLHILLHIFIDSCYPLQYNFFFVSFKRVPFFPLSLSFFHFFFFLYSVVPCTSIYVKAMRNVQYCAHIRPQCLKGAIIHVSPPPPPPYYYYVTVKGGR